MATLTQSQIYAIAVSTGLPQPKLMAAIAMAESSGRTNVVNPIGCVGLWQINQPVHVKDHPTWTKAWLSNPVNNARAAKVVYQMQGLEAWESYTDGRFKKYMDSTAQGITDIDPLDPFNLIKGNQGGDALDAAGGAVGSIGDIAGFAAKAGNWVSNPRNWLRIVYVIGGVALVVVGVSSLARPYVMKAANAATDVVPQGKALKAVKAAS